ncbi:alkaline phosphatase family protein [Halochromatium glycolicum]|uniref:Type I phosphodiesterase / nucleotide pyrophosphatase n=1 Tax=Halochromatium glycolicum TaxID=85075 RepID=A0AAJ0XB25_9GAMM|nr:alkaline phosphatase family protein [Halochromatium glycolicum]MBK1706371.1 hypothetical protein [Halochromatium glycolicum]
MKLLIIGIDGGDQRVFDAYSMPYYEQLRKRMSARTVTEDLHSRGWAEIVSGRPGMETGALYMAPKLDGSLGFSDSFQIASMLELPYVTPIWNLASRRGATVGVMNLPSASKAIPVNGFFVGSGGGGLHKVDGVPKRLVYPDDLLGELEQGGYIVDIRFKSSGIRDLEALFDRLGRMEAERVAAFVRCCQARSTDFGFVIDRATTVVQYLLRKVIEDRMAGDAGNQTELEALASQLLERFYQQVDENLMRLVEELQPNHLVLTADHGCVPYRYKGNVNDLLAANGWQAVAGKAGSTLARLRRSVRRMLPRSATQALKGSLPAAVKGAHEAFDRSGTKAFGHYHIPGVFINDKRRFGGPVADGAETVGLVEKICAAINADSEAQRFGLSARPYRSEYPHVRFADKLPDVWIDKPDELLFDHKTSGLVVSNPNYSPMRDLDSVNEDMYTGQKGRHPILLVDHELEGLSRPEDPPDLRQIHSLVGRVFD